VLKRRRRLLVPLAAAVWRRRGRTAAAIAWNMRDAPAAGRLASAVRADDVAWRGRTVVAAFARDAADARALTSFLP
jgi:hypothetical protein